MLQHQINLCYYFDHSGHNHNHQVSKANIYCKEKRRDFILCQKGVSWERAKKNKQNKNKNKNKKISSLPVDSQFLYKFHQDFQDHLAQGCKSHKHPLYHLMDHMGSNRLLLHNFDMFHLEDQMSSCNQKHLFIE